MILRIFYTYDGAILKNDIIFAFSVGLNKLHELFTI